MNFSPKCRTKKLGMIFTSLGIFCSFFNWEMRPRKFPVYSIGFSDFQSSYSGRIIPRRSQRDVVLALFIIAPDKDWRQLGIYPPLFDLIGYFKF